MRILFTDEMQVRSSHFITFEVPESCTDDVHGGVLGVKTTDEDIGTVNGLSAKGGSISIEMDEPGKGGESMIILKGFMAHLVPTAQDIEIDKCRQLLLPIADMVWKGDGAYTLCGEPLFTGQNLYPTFLNHGVLFRTPQYIQRLSSAI